jgi:hypothetical protein
LLKLPLPVPVRLIRSVNPNLGIIELGSERFESVMGTFRRISAIFRVLLFARKILEILFAFSPYFTFLNQNPNSTNSSGVRSNEYRAQESHIAIVAAHATGTKIKLGEKIDPTRLIPAVKA